MDVNDLVPNDPPSAEPSVAENVTFGDLVTLLEKIQRTQGNAKKREILAKFIQHWRDAHHNLHKGKKTTDSFYPAMRLLLPHLERERLAYGIKEHMLARLLIDVLCLGKDSADASKLLHYKTVKATQFGAGDFANIAYFVLKNRCPEKGTLTIANVNTSLDAIAVNNSSKKKELVRKNMMHLLRNLAALEQKWLIRMILKDLKIGLSQQSVFAVFHPDADEMYNVNNSLEKVCIQLHDPNLRSHEIAISVFSPFSPMLGEFGNPDKISKVMAGKQFFIETKFDGERMLLHKQKGEYKYFSRSGTDYSKYFGCTKYEGSLSQHIHNCFHEEINPCILDGEMLGYHSSTKTFGSKADHYDIKARDLGEYQACYFVFDILLYNDLVLSNRPLRERVHFLKKVFQPIEGRIHISEFRIANSRDACIDALNNAIDNREEGIMVKDCESVYRPSARRGGWFKLKPEYVDGLMDQLDVLIVGGFWGVGHRGGLMSHFLCAVALPMPAGKKPNVFWSFCKVGSGYTKKELVDFNKKLADYWQPFDRKNPPSSIILASGFKEQPDAWIEPSKSCIVQVKAAEIVSSGRFKTGYTLRFPRVEKIREDKPWFECMTTEDLDDLRQKSGGKLANRLLEVDMENHFLEVKRRKKAITQERPKVGANFQAADTSQVKQESDMLSNKEICVYNGSKEYSKAELEKLIVKFGGKVVQNPDSITNFVLADKVTVRVNNLVKANSHDIIKVSWFLKCAQAFHLFPWTPQDMIHASQGTVAHFQKDFDQFGDSYTQPSTIADLKQVFSNIDQSGFPRLTSSEIADVEEEYFQDESPYGLFRFCRVYIDNKLDPLVATTQIPHSPLDLLALELRYFGASIEPILTNNISHVIIDNGDLSRLYFFKDIRRQQTQKFHIISSKWIKDCLAEGELIKEDYYSL